MNKFRVVIAIMIFSVSSYLLYDLIANGFEWFVLFVVIGGYVLVHFAWPKSRADERAWYDVLEIIFDLPYRLIALLVRSIGRIFKDGDVGIDV